MLASAAVAVAGGSTAGLAQDFSCPAGAPAADPSVDTVLLPTLKAKVNNTWSTAAAQQIDPLDFDTGPQTSACPSDGGTKCFFSTGLVDCEHTTSDFQITNLVGLAGVRFSSIEATAFDPKDVSTHSVSGPDAGKISDGVFAPEGTTWNHPSYVVVLPLPGVGHALAVDLGSVVTVCGDSQCGPKVQADRHPFQVEYSSDGTSWIAYSTVPAVSGDGLRTRSLAQIAKGQENPSFSARYVRLYGLPADDTNYSVSELQLRDPSGNLLSLDKPAIGPRPYQIADGVVAPEGATWNDKSYAAVLRADGPGHALVIDLGSPIALCGSSACGPMIQADKNAYQFDYSLDALDWVPYAQLPAVSGTGLRTRSLAQRVSGTDNPAFTARYVRIWGLSGDGNYSVSEVTLRNTLGVAVAARQTFGPEPLATDGEVAPEGADWNDPRWANILPPCTTWSSSTCPTSSQKALTAGLPIDLTASFPIAGLVVQSDRHQFQVDYLDETTHVWRPLWTVPSTGGSGLHTRTTTLSAPLPVARHLLIYGTAGDDSNYSVSSVQVTTATAKTACAFASGADSGQAFSCSYDGGIAAGLEPSAGLAVSFNAHATAHLRCYTGDTYGSSPTQTIIQDGTTCTATLVPPSAGMTGSFCSGTCSSGPPSSVLTEAALDVSDFDVTNLSCTPNLDSDVLNGLRQVIMTGTGAAVAGMFNGLVVSPLGPSPAMVPSGLCKAGVPAPNAEVVGSASHVGRGSGAGHVRLTGTFTAYAPADLSELALELRTVIGEAGGVEELVRTEAGEPFAPLRLLPQPGSTADRAIYATAPGASPAVRAEVKRAKHGAAGEMEFGIAVHRATLPTLPSCDGATARVELATAFALTGDDGALIEATALQDWRCAAPHRLVTP